MSVLRSIIYYCLTAFTFVAGPIVGFVFRLIYGERGPSVTKVLDPLLLESATSLAKKIRSRQVTAEEVMQAFIKRAREVNPVINAIVAERYAEALQEAKEVDKVMSSDAVPEEFSQQNKPFLGVPLTVKEAFALQGMPNCSGLVSRKGVKAESDSPAVHRLKQAGMIPFACTNVSELCMWYESANNVYGRTKNAYDVTKIVGGSSGGEGCIISSGASLLGVGSDIGGSIRMPAFFNGVFGHRPSKDVVPNEGQHPPATGGQVELLATGPMCRYAEDLAPALRVMAGPNAAKLKLDAKVDMSKVKVYSMEDDGGSLLTGWVNPQLKEAQRKASNAAKLKLDAKVDMSKVKVYSMEDDGGSLLTGWVNPQLKEAQRKAFNHLGSVGATTKPVVLKLMKYSLELWSAKMVSGNGIKFACFMAGGQHSGAKVNCFLEFLKWVVRRSDHTLPAIGLGIAETFTPKDDPNIPRLLAMLDALLQELCALLADEGVLLYPSHPQPAPYHNHPLLTPFNFTYTAIFNALGLPVTQVPLGLSVKGGLPLGIQVVGAPYQDHLTLAVAAELERGLGGWVSPGV